MPTLTGGWPYPLNAGGHPRKSGRVDLDFVSVDQEGSGFEHAPYVERNGPFAAKILDQIPVEGGLVGAAALGMGAAERNLDGAADIFVE